ncbi:two component transcriptional regulator, LytTR family [Reichenbachiella faecimaris]|uniref:Two component transcriptional regulator, LytTR family n=1 Tax=Reichenbachiella faecimaris TaxID=692418 RepID=A0A1W2G5B0_REIFA|nr:response regulator [Reichenbachiella faecimaris]SMD31857.1 two component transcriptional regulator, LytTR family [Reichenbachiella faecimaris]
MTALKIMIVEDEMITAESIKDMLEELGYEVVGICMRAETALNAIMSEEPDFALLDVNLKGEKTGIWLAEQLKQKHNIPYVFLTSYGDKKTIEQAAETNPFGYLLKPIDKHHLYAAIEVAIKKFAEINNSASSNVLEEIVLKDSLFIKDEYLLVKVKFEDINLAKANGNYIEVHTNGKKHLIKGTLSTFMEILPKRQFFQTHRSYLINIEKINAIGGNYVKVDQINVPITATNKEELMTQLNLYKKG